MNTNEITTQVNTGLNGSALHEDGYIPNICKAAPGFPENSPARVFRAIYSYRNNNPLEFPRDRIGDIGDTREICRWLKKHYKRIQKSFRLASLNQDDTHWHSYDADGFRFTGNPNGSYGYMYCAAFRIG